MPAVCLSEARLEASDVGALVRKAHPCGGGLVRGGQVGVPKGRPALLGLQLCGVGVVCWVEECAEWVRCSFLSAEGGVEPAASDSEVGCYLLATTLSSGKGCGVWEARVKTLHNFPTDTLFEPVASRLPPVPKRGLPTQSKQCWVYLDGYSNTNANSQPLISRLFDVA